MPDAVAPAAPAEPAAAPAAGSSPPAAAEPAPAAKQETRPDPVSPQFAQLAKQTQRLAAEKRAWAAERQAAEQALKQKEAEVSARATKAEELERLKDSALKDPGVFLRGVYGDAWYDKLTEYKLTGEKAPPADLAVEAVRQETTAEIARLRKEQEEWRAQQESARKAQIEAEKARLEAERSQVKDDFRAECVDFVKANAAKYELINLTESQDQVYAVIEGMYNQTGRLLSESEAADLVEAELEKAAERVFTGKKWQARQKPAAEAAVGGEPPKTLTNTIGSGANTPSTSGAKKDRYQLAIEAMEAHERELKARAAK